MSDETKHTGTKDPRIEAAIREYLERVDHGEPVDREEFLARHALIADQLRSFIAAEDKLRKLAGDKASRESAGISTRSFAAGGQETVPPKSNPDRSPAMTGSGLQGQFGRYQIIRALGKGAMGAVYLAQDTQLKRNVAIKTPHFEADPTGELLKRFYREAEAAATLLHANICPVYDVGEIDGKHFISMAYIEGRSLSDLIKSDKAQNERQIVIAVQKLARALQQAHDHDIVHRDLKPANIMINRQGEPIIMDFGLARKRRAEGEASLTHSGVLLGSPAYMSPEQIEGDPDNVGPPSDQYSLGVVLYEILTGQLPFRGSVVNVLAQILTKDLTRPSELRPGLDPRIEAVCLRMMSKKASGRFPSMKSVAEELYAILKTPAAEPIDAATSPRASRPPAAHSPSRSDANESQNSVKQKVLTETDVASLEELISKCLRRHDYEQVIQIVERIPEGRRSEGIQSHLATAREKTDEIAFLICEIDEADRLEDGLTALKKAEELSKLKPGHHRAQAIQEKYSGYGDGCSVRVDASWRSTQRWDQGGWIPWTALAFGLAVVGVMTGVMYFYLRGTWIVVDVQDPDVKVTVKDSTLTITGPAKKDVKVEPGNQELTIAYGDLNFTTKTFTLKKGETKTVTISVVDKNVVVKLSGEGLSLEPQEKVGKTAPVGPAAGNREVAGLAAANPQGKRLPSAGDPDRRAAEAVLALGGSVTIRVDNREEAIEAGKALPSQSFQLTQVRLIAKSNMTDAALEPLRDATNVVVLWLDRSPITDNGLECIGGLTKLESLGLAATRVSGPGLAHLKKMTRLKALNLEGAPTTDAGLANLEGLAQLEMLWLGSTRVTDTGLAHLKGFENLRALNIGETEAVTDAGLARLTALPHLTELFLGNSRVAGITDAGIHHLGVFKDLTTLDLHGSAITDAALAELGKLNKLTTLNLRWTRITDGGLAPLRRFRELRWLSLGGTSVTDKGLEILKGMVGLRDLDLRDAKVTAAGVDKLGESLPACRIISNFPTAATAPVKHSSESDRRAAETVLALAGSVVLIVDGHGEQTVEPGGKLPADPFELVKIRLRGKPNLTDADLHPFAGLDNLEELDLDGSKSVTDAGVISLKRLPHLNRLDLTGTQVTDEGLGRLKESHLQDLPSLRFLGLGVTRVTNEGLANLKGWTELRDLTLFGTAVTDVGLASLKELPQLEYLNLNSTKVTDAGLAHLSVLSELFALNVADTRVTGSGIGHLRGLKRLRELGLGGVRITDAALARVDGMVHLQRLGLDRTSVTDAGLRHLSHLAELTFLDIGRTRIGDAGLVHLKSLVNLQSLELNETRVTDAGLPHLQQLKTLNEINLRRTRVTSAGAKRLRNALPGCRIDQ